MFEWKFPINDGPGEEGINNSGVSTFKGSQLYNNLAREICQNSLDAKSPEERTVVVKFDNIIVEKQKYPSIASLEIVFKECRDYWDKRMDSKMESFLNEAETKISKEEIDCLIISDYNTSGLSGVNAESTERSKWRALTSSVGVTDKDNGSGGSYGIGKSAPFACSSFRTVYYNTYAREDKIKAFQGVALLATHQHEGKKTWGTGYFINKENRPFLENDPCEFRDLLNRESYGTDVVIVGFKKTASWNEDIEKAIIENFFVAIANNDLVVEIDGILLDSNTINSRIEYYTKKEVDSKDKKITTIMEFYHTLTQPDHIVIKGSIIEKDDVTLYLRKDDNYSRSIAEMRSIGMVVRTRHKNILSRYAAVMMVGSGKLNNLLKNTEPPTHREWDPDLIENEEERNYATIKRRELINWTNNQIIDNCKSEDTSELDLDGISAYLPYDEDDITLGNDEAEDASPDAKALPGKQNTKKSNVKKVTLSAKKTKGVKEDDKDSHNKSNGGNAGGHSGGTEDPKKDDDAVVPVAGKKTVNIPKVLQQRIVQMPTDSTYRVMFTLENDCDKVHLEVKALGDDGGKDSINILNYKMGKSIIDVNSNVMQINNIRANEQNIVFVKLEYSEKLALQLQLY